MPANHNAPPRVLVPEPLTPKAFAPFGDVIQAKGALPSVTINGGYAQRFNDLAAVDVARGGGRANISIFRAKPRMFPLQLHSLERHPLGSQAFFSLSQQPFLVVVAPVGDVPETLLVRCFLAGPGQGVNYHAGTWHHALIALESPGDFLVVDRAAGGATDNCDECELGSKISLHW
ncbi:MAG: ureidoglycolate lyase [Betaproteobacteria bacterium]